VKIEKERVRVNELNLKVITNLAAAAAAAAAAAVRTTIPPSIK
jgi:hypothetical protein